MMNFTKKKNKKSKQGKEFFLFIGHFTTHRPSFLTKIHSFHLKRNQILQLHMVTHTNNIYIFTNQTCKTTLLCLFSKSTEQIEERKAAMYIYPPEKPGGTRSSMSMLVYQFLITRFFSFCLMDQDQDSMLKGLSIHSFSKAILPEPRPTIFPIVLTADNPLKLLLPSLKFHDLLDFLNFGELTSSSWSAVQSSALTLATISWTMLLLQNGQTGTVGHAVIGLGLLWQHKAKVHCAHIWWPQFWTSIVQTWSKHIPHSSVSLVCIKLLSQWISWNINNDPIQNANSLKEVTSQCKLQ